MRKSKNQPRTVQHESCVIHVRVVPRSSRVSIEALSQDLYKVKLTSPPVDGAANEQLVKVLGEKLSVPSSNIEVVSGSTSRLKRIRIIGVSPIDLPRLLCGSKK